MIQIRKEENQKKQKEKKLKVYKVNTHKKTVIALWVLLAVSFLFAVYKNCTAIDIHTVHEPKVIEEKIIDTHKIENFVENFAEVSGPHGRRPQPHAAPEEPVHGG